MVGEGFQQLFVLSVLRKARSLLTFPHHVDTGGAVHLYCSSAVCGVVLLRPPSEVSGVLWDISAFLSVGCFLVVGDESHRCGVWTSGDWKGLVRARCWCCCLQTSLLGSMVSGPLLQECLSCSHTGVLDLELVHQPSGGHHLTTMV